MSVDVAPADTYIESLIETVEPTFDASPSSRGRRSGSERTVLGRAAVIMDAFNSTHRVLSLIELSHRTGLPKSTLHRLAEQLCQVGWIRRVPGGYRIGMRMFELGSLALEADRLQEAAYPHLRSLAARTGMYVHLSIPNEAEVVHLERIAAGPLRLATRRGERAPAYCTALGKAMAASDDDLTQAVLDAPMPRRTDNTITDERALLDEFRRVRHSGIAVDRSEYCPQIVCVAAPIRQGHTVVGAISVTGTAGQIRGDVASASVLDTAASIMNSISTHGKKPRRL
ncbi:IclR family transcriptional regulator [Rhodococcus sp. NPDC003318]|uniref:IclR family transcriptional regulator n=1 Tax=Rhodococcus sp. NPDC003318 TaxID=3364503 RepID=UPI00369D2B68